MAFIVVLQTGALSKLRDYPLRSPSPSILAALGVVPPRHGPCPVLFKCIPIAH